MVVLAHICNTLGLVYSTEKPCRHQPFRHHMHASEVSLEASIGVAKTKFLQG
jgi:hypothetical protein